MIELLTLLQNNGYLIVFLLAFLYGPVVPYAAGFLSSLNVMGMFGVITAVFLGNVIPDAILFWIGKTSRIKTINKLADYLHLTKPRREKIEGMLNKHLVKAVILFKLIPGVAIPGMVLAGYSKTNMRKFTTISMLYNIIAAILFTFLGYYSGIASSIIAGKNLVIILIVLIIVIYGLLKHFKNKL